MNKPPLIVLDVDYTLTSHNSWTELTRALGASLEDHLILYQRLIDGEIEINDANARLVKIWRATGNANRNFIERTFGEIPVRTEATELVRWLSQNKFRTCLISASMDLYVSAIARRLRINTWFANGQLIFDNQGFLVGLSYDHNQSAKKLDQLKKICLKERFDIKKVVTVGDGANDLELFRITGHGILVNDKPTSELQAAAWKTVASLFEIPLILSADTNDSESH